MTFNESNTVEAWLRDRLCGRVRGAPLVRESGPTYRTSSKSGTGILPVTSSPTPDSKSHRQDACATLGWRFVPPADVPRQSQDVLVEPWLREALIRLNPDIAAQPDRADDVLYKLRAIIMGVRTDGLVKANEEFAAWLNGERSMPFGENGEHVTIRLLDFVHTEQNDCVVTTQYTFRAGNTEKRADLVLLMNGIPLVVIEAKTPVRSSQSWLDGAVQVHDDYEKNIPELFVPNLLSIATEGKEFRYGSIGLPVELWGPWRIETDEESLPSLQQLDRSVNSLLRPWVLLDLLANFTAYATDKKKRRMKIVARYQQYEAANKIVDRVINGQPKKGLIWHFQGSGKSLLMLFAARKLRLHPVLKNPTVIIVVDRIDLDTQISSTFYAADTPNLVKAESRSDLQRLLAQDVRKIIITTIFKFGEANSQSGTGFQPVTSTDHGQDASASLFNPHAEIERSRRNLPHWKQDGKTYFVTFRLADSLPKEKREQLKADREAWRQQHGETPPTELSPANRNEYYRLFHERVQQWLDAEEGSCALRQPKVAEIVCDALRHFDGQRYSLGAWVVAGNHVHVVLTPAEGEDLSRILHSWKSFTATKINKMLQRSGAFWLDENYDHLVRSREQLAKIEEYVLGHESEWKSHRQDACATLNARDNIIVLVDEAHRTQEGDLGRKMREALPNAFLFGLTGTPINRADRNTFYAFGAEEDQAGYMSRYGFEESIRDGATMPLHFEPRLLDMHIDKAAIDEAFKDLTGGLSDLDRDQLAKTAAKMAVLVKSPERIQKICADIARHFQEKVAPSGFGAQVVTFDRDSCVRYKKALDEFLPTDMSAIVMTVNSGEDEYAAYQLDRDEEEKLLDRFRDPADPLKILIVTSKLLTGFDAPILQAMYLDKPLRDHTLLQAICRTNRPYGEAKTHGLIVDYLGVFDDVAQAIQFDEEGITRVIRNISELKNQLPAAVQKCLAYFQGVDRALTGYEGLMAAQECLPNNKVRDDYARDFSYLSRLWEAISPDPVLTPFETDYRWLSQVYESVKPATGNGRLLWHALGPKTIELIHEHVHVDAVRDDLETLVLDADLLEAVLGTPDPKKKSKEIEIKVSRWLRKRLHDPRFKPLGDRLEELKEKHEQGLITSVEFLKALLELARDVVSAEREQPPLEREEQGKAALTELFEDARTADTPIMVERVVSDIDEIVRYVRFDGWQSTHAGERQVRNALRKTLFKYRLHQEQELFDRAYGYIREYY